MIIIDLVSSLVISKGTTESDLKNDFEQFGQLQDVKVITTDSGQSKGCAFIKFTSPYNAALALENCPSDYKIEYAAPKRRSYADEPSSFNSSNSSQTSTPTLFLTRVFQYNTARHFSDFIHRIYKHTSIGCSPFHRISSIAR